MDWDKLKIFHAVAEAGSFTNATVNLNLSQSAIRGIFKNDRGKNIWKIYN